jgi:hypothetical protein
MLAFSFLKLRDFGIVILPFHFFNRFLLNADVDSQIQLHCILHSDITLFCFLNMSFLQMVDVEDRIKLYCSLHSDIFFLGFLNMFC